MKGVALGEDVDLDELASLCEDYSGADIACVCRDASLMSMRRLMGAARERARKQAASEAEANGGGGGGGGGGFMAMRGELLQNREALVGAAVAHDDFKVALKKISRSVGKEELARYQSWMDEYGSA